MKRISILREYGKHHITREDGERLRHQIQQILSQGKTAEVDFENLRIASSSFLDEGILKLISEDLSIEHFQKRLHLKNMHQKDQETLKELWSIRFKGSPFPADRS